MTDLRVALRLLRKQPGTSILAVLALSLGIALTTTMFSIVNGAVLRGLPFEDSDRIFSLSRFNPGSPGDGLESPTLLDFTEWRTRQTAFESLAAFTVRTANMVGPNGVAERYTGAWVTPNTFGLVRTRPALGRDFREEDGRPGAPAVVIISDKIWRERFEAAPDAVGRPVRINGTVATVIGVMPPRFGFPNSQSVWLPLTVVSGAGPAEAARRVSVIGRLPRSASLAQAEATMVSVARQVADAHPDTNKDISVRIATYVQQFLGTQTINALFTMLAATMGVMVIACVNVANLVMARAIGRTREIAIRTAIGASRFTVVRQMLVEVLVLAGVGAAIGVGLAQAGITLFNRAIVDTSPPFWLDIRLDGTVLLFVTATAVAAALVAGLVPAIRASRTDLVGVINDEGRSTGLRMGRFTRGLVVVEMAVSFALVVVSALIIQSVVNLQRLDLGFAKDDVWVGTLVLPTEQYPDETGRAGFAERLTRELSATSGVVTAALTTALPPNSGADQVRMPGQEALKPQELPRARRVAVTPGYFSALRVGITQGRDFDGRDSASAAPVAIVNQSFARRYFPEGAVGRQVKIGASPEVAWRTIVGIVPDLGFGDSPSNGIRLAEGVYVPFAQSPPSGFWLVAQTAGPPLDLTESVRRVVRGIDPDLPIFGANSLRGQLDQSAWAFRVFGSIFMAAGFAALFLATVGLYGVMAFSVSRRTQEFGVRMAMGAREADVLGLVLRQAGIQVAIGTAGGVLLGAGLSRLMALLLFGVSPYDPTIFVLVGAVFVITGFIAGLVPARRAARAAPLVALRG